MSGPAITLVAFVLGLTLVAAFAFGSPIFGSVVAVAALGVVGALEIMRRKRKMTDVTAYRERADAQKTEFTQEDRRTQVPEDI